MSVDELWQGIARDPARVDEAIGYYKVIVTALNKAHKNGEQDGLCVFEGVAMLLGQIIANGGQDERHGLLTYVGERALVHASDFLAAGTAARHLTVRDDA